MSRTVLAIGGHIGDMDLTAGPTLATWALQGDRAIILSCTYGERGHPRLSPDDYRQQKIAEGEQFASDIGAEFRTLDYSDGFLPDDDEVAGQIADMIRTEEPEIIITHWKRSIHRDHERTSTVTERARFLAGLPLDHPLGRHAVSQILYAENWEDDQDFRPDRYVPIPTEAYQIWRSAIEKQAFARGETYGFRYIDYYTALMTMRGCLARQERACAFSTEQSPGFVVSPL